jgi:hypothetical protein
MSSPASTVGKLMLRHEIERNQQEDDFAREEQRTRAKADQERQDLCDKQQEQARTPPRHAGRAPIVVPDDQRHAEERASRIRALHLEHAKKRKARDDRQHREIEAARRKPATPGATPVPAEPEKHHYVSVIWRDLDSARRSAVREVQRQYALLHDNQDAEHLNVLKSQAVGRYAKGGTRTADDVTRRHEEAHYAIAKREYEALSRLADRLESEIEGERRRNRDQARERAEMDQRHWRENHRAVR